jgi:hypothetical protein
MRRTAESSTDAVRNDAIAQWGKVCDESVKRYFDASRNISAAALKSQCALLDAAGQMLVAGNRIVARNIEQLADAKNSGKDVRKSS